MLHSISSVLDIGRMTWEENLKYYHASVVKSKKNSVWYVYFEYARTGAATPSIQFVECADKIDAHTTFAKQLHSKNDKRGEWVTKPGLGKILKAKKNKDCYLVRPLATRDSSSPGLPSACSITSDDVIIKATKKINKRPSKKHSNFDPNTLSLMRDLNVASIKYAKTTIQGGQLPTQASIDEARIVLIEAQKRLKKTGDTIEKQIKDKALKDLTCHLYSRVHKVKSIGADESTWVLNKNNIFAWQQDLDAFESALSAVEIDIEDSSVDPSGGMNIEMEWLPPASKLGKFIHNWMPSATRNKHGGVGAMRIKNLWKVERLDASSPFNRRLDSVLRDRPSIQERPGQQPRRWRGLSDADEKRYRNGNVGLMFHGSRSVNISGILREGLRLPKQLVGVVITGALYGPGSYWASDWKKSAGYTSLQGSYWSGGSGSIRGRGAFMFVADVILGRAHLSLESKGYINAPKNCHSVLGKAQVSKLGTYGGYLQNDEWVTYNTDQNQLRYLVEFYA